MVSCHHGILRCDSLFLTQAVAAMLPVQRAPVQVRQPEAVLRAGATQGRPTPWDRSQEDPSVLGKFQNQLNVGMIVYYKTKAENMKEKKQAIIWRKELLRSLDGWSIIFVLYPSVKHYLHL